MIPLNGKAIGASGTEQIRGRGVFRLGPTRSGALAALVGYDGTAEDPVLAINLDGNVDRRIDDLPVVSMPAEFIYLAPGDVVSLSEDHRRLRVLYRRNSKHNSFLVTERCDNYCLMCSQPPKPADDSWLVDDIEAAIPLIAKGAHEIGFTGGEPTLLGDRFVDVLALCNLQLPDTVLHVLSNGRRFSDTSFAKKWASVEHHDLMVGIPVYSDIPSIHDYVVQADGAFDETIRGILNLKRLGQQVEIRIVLHKQTTKNLARWAEFIVRNLLFVDHVALMGLEIMGFTRANLPDLWIDPSEYQEQLGEAVHLLHAAGMRVSIYNLPLCLVRRDLWPFTVQSISDWKNEYLPQCDDCAVKSRCAGFFWSARFKGSSLVHPIQAEEVQQI